MRRAAVALVLLPLAPAACGGGKSSSQPELSPAASVKSAAAKTARTSSEHVTINGSASVAGNLVTVTGNGDFDNAGKQGTMHVDFSVGGLGGSAEEVTSGTTIYLRSPLFASSLPSGKTWMKVDLAKVGESKGIDLSALGIQDPGRTLAELQAIRNVTKVGDETIKGSDTTHYRGRVDVSKVAQAAKIKALAIAKYGPFDVWIGKDDGYVHRIKLSYALGTAGAGRQAVALTMDLSDFGKSVTVTTPSPAESFDATNASIIGLGG
jgi:hypothetical protein